MNYYYDNYPKTKKEKKEQLLLRCFYVSFILIIIGCVYFYNYKSNDKTVNNTFTSSINNTLMKKENIIENKKEEQVLELLNKQSEGSLNNNIAVEKVVLKYLKYTLNIGQKLKMPNYVKPRNATNQNLTWSSNNTNVATVSSDGIITAINSGTTKIVAKSNNGKYAECVIVVREREVPVTSVKLTSSFVNISVGNTYNLYATTLPLSATNKELNWTSSNPHVATVSNGVVTANNGGTAIITVKTANGLTASATISVKARAATVSEMKASFSKIVSKNGSGYYAYAPSVMIKNNQTYIYSCQNTKTYQTHDSIYLNTSTRNLILTPTIGWDSYHICDPSIVEGNFRYNGTNYTYAMAYLGIDNGSGKGNNIGLALSNDLYTGWIKVGSQPYVSSDTTTKWGVGQPSLIYVDGRLIMFYTNDTSSESNMKVKIINPNSMQVEASLTLSTNNTTWMHNADFAYKDNRLYVAYEGDESLKTRDIISDTIQIRSVYIADFTNIKSYANLNWEYENTIGSNVSGEKRNTNAGLFRNQYGELQSRTVAFTATSYGRSDGHFNYNIFKSSF